MFSEPGRSARLSDVQQVEESFEGVVDLVTGEFLILTLSSNLANIARE